jgi:hypothetical protein
LKHYDETKWIDFARGLITGAARKAMQAHLDAGCERCRRVLALFRAAVEVVASDARWEVPDHVLHSARAIFALQRPEKVQILPRIPARLVYDSFREPLPVGMRGQHRISRQALYEAGDYSVDLRLEHERGSSQMTLVGQIANRKRPECDMGNIPVLLMSGKSVLGRALSNTFGEFQMEYQPSQHLRLYVPVEEQGRGIQIGLMGLTTHSPEDKGVP